MQPSPSAASSVTIHCTRFASPNPRRVRARDDAVEAFEDPAEDTAYVEASVAVQDWPSMAPLGSVA